LGGSGRDNQHDLDKMLSSLGVQPVSEVLSSLSSISSEPNVSMEPQSDIVDSARHSMISRRVPTLSIVSVQTTNIPPKESVTYERGVQTTGGNESHGGPYFNEWWRPRKDEYNLNPGLEWDDEFTAGDEEDASLSMLDTAFGGGAGKRNHLPPGILPTGMPQVQPVKPALPSGDKEQRMDESSHAVPTREFSEEEKKVLMMTENFHEFFNRSTRLVERALAEDDHLYLDYSHNYSQDLSEEEDGCRKVSLSRTFTDERWSRNRCVTCLDWCPQYPELLLASYNNNVDTPHEPDGVVLVWNSKFKKSSPEFIFHCQSPVMSTAFSRFHPNLIVGGTYSGQIVMWDNRTPKRTPVQRSPLTSLAHTHPVHCLRMVGTQNAHSLISISTDGKLCSWSLDMLSTPHDVQDLQKKQNRNMAVTSLSFLHSDINNFVVGSEEGAVYTACRHGNKTGIVDVYEGHGAPITGVSAHPNPGPIDFSHLVLSSSMDWTVKLWSIKDTKPLYSFDNSSDYVYDVAWSPTHPAVFASVDGAGRLDLWDLNRDTEVATASVVLDGCPAINKVAWASSGAQLAVGDDGGKVHLFDVADHLSAPRPDDWNRLVHTLAEMRTDQTEEDLRDDRSSMSSLVSR